MRYKLEEPTLDSRRGRYNVVSLDQNPIIWQPLSILNRKSSRLDMVISEVDYALDSRLDEHKYWVNEPLEFVEQYQEFYQMLFSLSWLNNKADRHNIMVCEDCCLTLIQYHNNRLIAYSRSTDMRNGYYSDKLLLEYLAYNITANLPDFRVDTIEWHLAIPHVYEKTGIARLTERTDKL